MRFNSQTGVFHVVSGVVGCAYFLEEGNGREEFMSMMRAYEDVCGVEVLTGVCLSSGHWRQSQSRRKPS